MTSIPKTPYRLTKHKRPRHQLYIPGFNPANGCWLDGDWITVPKDEYERRLPEHKRMFGRLASKAAKQHYRDKSVPLDKMNDAQRVAYEHFSGNVTLYAQGPGGTGPVSITMAGNKPNPKSLAWMRDHDIKLLHLTRNGHTGEVTDQLDGLAFPDDVISTTTEPLDPEADIVEQNKRREIEMFDGMLSSATPGKGTDGPLGSTFGGFAAGMAMHSLVAKEETIIQTEWDQGRGVKDPYADLDRDVREYIEMRTKLKGAFGDGFDAAYEQQRATHNECARHNLGDHGTMFCFVLPNFNDDGTHEPWGEKDVPWGVETDA